MSDILMPIIEEGATEADKQRIESEIQSEIDTVDELQKAK